MDPNAPSREGYAEVGSAHADEVTVSLDHNNNSGGVPADVNTVPMPDQTAAGSVPPSLEGEFLHRPMEHIEKIGMPFKIHAGVGLGATVLCFFSTISFYSFPSSRGSFFADVFCCEPSSLRLA